MSKYIKGFKASFTFISLGILLGITSLAAIANAQEVQECQHDPFPSDAPNVPVACDDPSCNVGPCTNSSSRSAGQGPTSGAEEFEGSLHDLPTSTPPDGPVRNHEVRQLQQPPRGQAVEHRAALPARAQERITNLAANMSNRMEAAIARLENVIGRLESRIEKLSEAGVLTADAAGTLASAEAELARAREALAGIDGEVAAMVGSETPRETWRSLRETYTIARDAIFLSHQGLRNTLAILKQAVAEAEVGEGVSDAVDNATTSQTEAAEEATQ